MTIGYKLTDSNDRTRGHMQWGPGVTQWGPGVTHMAPGEEELCSDGWLHFYPDPLMAVLMDPIHAGYLPRGHLWEVEFSGRHIHDGTKSGAQSVTTIRRIEAPAISLAQRVRWAVYSVQEVGGGGPLWDSWAAAWLSGVNRSAAAAWEATAKAWATATKATAKAAAAAWEAAWAEAARAAAWEAAWAATVAGSALDLVELAERAIRDEAA